jgi:hypothetical protein
MGCHDCSRCVYYVKSFRTWIKPRLIKVKWRSGSWTGSEADKKAARYARQAKCKRRADGTARRHILKYSDSNKSILQNSENRKHFLRFNSKVKQNLIHLNPSNLHNRTLKWVFGASTITMKSPRPFTEVNFWTNDVLVLPRDIVSEFERKCLHSNVWKESEYKVYCTRWWS